MLELIKEILNLLNSVEVGVIANYISRRIDKRLDGRSVGTHKKH